MKKNTDVPGDSVGSHQAYVRQLVTSSEILLDFAGVLVCLDDREQYATGLTIRFPQADNPEYLAILRVETPLGKMVAFHAAPTFLETVTGLAQRMRNGTLRFKEDAYD